MNYSQEEIARIVYETNQEIYTKQLELIVADCANEQLISNIIQFIQANPNSEKITMTATKVMP